jgi:hypothetical protein
MVGSSNLLPWTIIKLLFMQTSQKMIASILDYVEEGSLVLEPSAGYGHLAAAAHVIKRCTVDCIELHDKCIENLLTYQQSGSIRDVTKADFLLYPKKAIYDHVIAVPPYKDNIDCQHIIKMYDFVREEGTIISFTLPHWVTGFYTNQVEFRQWLSDKDYEIKIFDDDESYLSCPKMLLVVRKSYSSGGRSSEEPFLTKKNPARITSRKVSRMHTAGG